jgi:hypothetical protein
LARLSVAAFKKDIRLQNFCSDSEKATLADLENMSSSKADRQVVKVPQQL